MSKQGLRSSCSAQCESPWMSNHYSTLPAELAETWSGVHLSLTSPSAHLTFPPLFHRCYSPVHILGF